MDLTVSNETTMAVELVVNGVHVGTVPSQMVLIEPADELPPLPWRAEVRTEGGRALLALLVQSGDVWWTKDMSGFVKGDGARVDLSCGRIDIWSGPPLNGPAPGPGHPGDCGP
jgi:hypothetical protein